MSAAPEHDHDAAGCLDCPCNAAPWSSRTPCTCPPRAEIAHYPSLVITDGTIGCDCGWETTRTRIDQAVQDYAEHAKNPSPAGFPAPTMDPSERANDGTAVASRTGTGPAGEATSTSPVPLPHEPCSSHSFSLPAPSLATTATNSPMTQAATGDGR